MKVKHLIEKLQRYDPETMVVVNGYEGGVNACSVCREKYIKLGVNSEWHVINEFVDLNFFEDEEGFHANLYLVNDGLTMTDLSFPIEVEFT